MPLHKLAHGRIVEEDVLSAQPAAAEEPRIIATPLARRLAQEHGVDISTIQGTGPGARVAVVDVQDRDRDAARGVAQVASRHGS